MRREVGGSRSGGGDAEGGVKDPLRSFTRKDRWTGAQDFPLVFDAVGIGF